jgi:hypothetical protein
MAKSTKDNMAKPKAVKKHPIESSSDSKDLKKQIRELTSKCKKLDEDNVINFNVVLITNLI